jgi:hypothetical protein
MFWAIPSHITATWVGAVGDTSVRESRGALAASGSFATFAAIYRACRPGMLSTTKCSAREPVAPDG